MELITIDFIYAVLSVILIDLVLGGDNAIVIGMAARNLPQNLQKKAIFWGTGGAVAVRITATILIVWLLKIPGLQLIGGVLLVGIAYKLLIDKKEEHQMKVQTGFWAAVGTIVMADAAMGIDNMLAVAGAAHSSIPVVIIGLLISIPIIIWGSTIVIKLIERFPVIVYLGAAVIAYVGGSMLTEDILIRDYFMGNHYLQICIAIVVMLGVLMAGKLKNAST